MEINPAIRKQLTKQYQDMAQNQSRQGEKSYRNDKLIRCRKCGERFPEMDIIQRPYGDGGRKANYCIRCINLLRPYTTRQR